MGRTLPHGNRRLDWQWWWCESSLALGTSSFGAKIYPAVNGAPLNNLLRLGIIIGRSIMNVPFIVFPIFVDQ